MSSKENKKKSSDKAGKGDRMLSQRWKKKAETRRRAEKVADRERKLCQEKKKKKERVGKTSERKLHRKELQTEGGVQRGDPGDRGRENATGGRERENREGGINS